MAGYNIAHIAQRKETRASINLGLTTREGRYGYGSTRTPPVPEQQQTSTLSWGKTSGSGQAIAKAFLEAGFGGLVLTAKLTGAQGHHSSIRHAHAMGVMTAARGANTT
jgi:hypothetical protein